MLVLLGAGAILKVDSFIEGYLGYPTSIAYDTVFVGLWLVPLALILLGYRLCRKIFRRKTVRFWTPLTILSLICLSYYIPLPLMLSDVHQRGFACYARRTFNVPEIAAWAKSYKPRPPKDQYEEQWEYAVVPPEDLPPSLKVTAQALWDGDRWEYRGDEQLGPAFLFYKKDRTLRILYGSGMMGCWGLIVGSGAGRDGWGISLGDDASVYEGEGSPH